MTENLARRCIVTGAGSGLGRAMALGLARSGASVLAADVNTGALSDTVRQAAGAPGRIVPYTIDLTRIAECEEMVARTLDDFGAIDVLVNCAGLNMALLSSEFLTSLVRFWEVDPEKWQRMYDVNVRAPFLLAKLSAPHMARQGWGRIVNVTTSFSTMLREGNTPYGQTKAALEAASAGWAHELEGSGVTCNVLIPGGAADTPMIPHDAPIAREKLVPPPAMVAPLLYLASDRSDAVSGVRIVAIRWDPQESDSENLRRAAAPIGWPELAAASGAPTRGSVATSAGS